MEATGAKDYRKECRYGAKCYQKNPEHKAKFKHTEREKVEQERENKENVKEEGNREVKDQAEKKRALSEDSTDGDQVDAKKVKHDVSDSEGGETSQDEEEVKEEDEVFDDLVAVVEGATGMEEVEALTGLTMPADFLWLWEFARSVDKEAPLACLKSVGLRLCGAFEVLAGEVPAGAPRSRALHRTHHRYYYDTPEVQTLVCEVQYKTGLHLGYFRDSPTCPPSLVVSSVEGQGPRLTPLGDNLFAGLYNHLQASLDTVDPFTRARVAAMMERVKLWVNRKAMEGEDSLSLERRTPSYKKRDRAKVAMGAHMAGVVVPYDRQTQVGWREVPETKANIKKMVDKVEAAETEEEKDAAMEQVQQLVTWVQYANDEGDPGMGLELGLDLFCHGGKAVEGTAHHLLTVSYELLDREEFGEVAKAHLARRVRGGQDAFARWRQ